ncbi:MAG: response regulator [PVC group bacterium]
MKKRIMIVEDEGIVARDLEKTLLRLGYEVTAVVHSGPEAVRRAVREKPDLVLMDIVLPGEMDGIAAAAQIRARANVPIIYLTAYADNEILQRAMVTTPFGYILKPFRERELYTNIETALCRHAMEEEREKLFNELQEALARIKTLEGILPICSHCKKIRDETGRWREVSAYLHDHSRVQFTHGICPDCIQNYYPGFSPGRPDNPTAGREGTP